MSASLIPSPYELAFRLRAARQAAREGNGEVLGKALAGLRTALEDYAPASDPVDVALGALAVRQIAAREVASGHIADDAVEDQAANWGAGGAPRQAQGWNLRRLGADPPSALVNLLEIAGRDVLAACGINPAVFSDGQGVALRSDWSHLSDGWSLPSWPPSWPPRSSPSAGKSSEPRTYRGGPEPSRAW